MFNKKLKYYELVLIFLFIGVIFSCKKDKNKTENNNIQFIELTIIGKKIRQDYPLDTLTLEQGIENYNCSNQKPRRKNSLNITKWPGWNVNSRLFYYCNSKDFIKANTGLYSMVDGNNSSSCNFTLELNLYYERIQGTDNYKIGASPTHKVTSISLINQDSDNFYYLIKGEFIADYGFTTNIEGKYQQMVKVAK